MKTEFLGNKIKGKIKFLGDEKETQEVERKIFNFVRKIFSLKTWRLAS
jgi:hypothetical protein